MGCLFYALVDHMLVVSLTFMLLLREYVSCSSCAPSQIDIICLTLWGASSEEKFLSLNDVHALVDRRKDNFAALNTKDVYLVLSSLHLS